MLIDWFTVAAQAVNFLILVWLLKHFLYGPILDAIEKRKKGIEDQLQAAEDKLKEAEAEKDKYESEQQLLQEKRDQLMADAARKADERRKKLFASARQAAEQMRASFQQAIREEQRALRNTLAQQVQTEVFAISRQALKDLASAELEDAVVQHFLDRLRQLDEKEKQQVALALEKAEGKLRVTTAFELPAQQRKQLLSTLGKMTPQPIHPRFTTAPDQVGGMALTAGGYKLAWSIDEYLGELQRKLSELLDKEEEEHVEALGKPPKASPDEKT